MQLFFFLLTRSMLERPPKDDMERWTTIAWAIWRARNKFCFEDFRPRLEAILRKVTSFLHEYQMLVANQWTHQLFERMGVIMIFFFFFVLGVRLVCVALEHIRPLLTPLYKKKFLLFFFMEKKKKDYLIIAYLHPLPKCHNSKECNILKFFNKKKLSRIRLCSPFSYGRIRLYFSIIKQKGKTWV